MHTLNLVLLLSSSFLWYVLTSNHGTPHLACTYSIQEWVGCEILLSHVKFVYTHIQVLYHIKMFNILINSKTVYLYTDKIVNPCLYLFIPVHSRQQTAHILINEC